MTSGSSPIRTADCRVGERIFILIRPASRWRSGAEPSGGRCESPVLLTPVCWPSTSARSPRPLGATDDGALAPHPDPAR